MWEEALVWKRKWGERYRVEWVRGHADRDKEMQDLTKHEMGNWWCDMRCKVVHEGRWPWGTRKQRVREGQWQVRVGGEVVVGELDEEIRKRVEEVRFEGYMRAKGHGQYEQRMSRVMREMMKVDEMGGVGKAVRLAKHMWDQLPVMARLHRWGWADSGKCPCEGCEGIEDGWHCVGECICGNAGELRRGLVEEFGRQVDNLGSLGKDLRW